MDILRRHLPVFQAPDPPNGGTESALQSSPPVDSAAAEPAPVAADAPPAADPAPVERTVSQRVFLERLGEETGKRRAAEEKNVTLSRSLAEATAMLERLQQPDPAKPGEQRRPLNITPLPDNDDAAVTQRAQRLIFEGNVNDVRNAGFKEFGPAFNETINIVSSLGVDDGFLDNVLAVDKANAHKLLTTLAKEKPEQLVAMTRMSPAQRIAELTRMSMPQAAPAQQQQQQQQQQPRDPAGKFSKAPPPPPPVDPTSKKTVDWRSDDASDEEFTNGFNEMMQRKSARR